MISALRLKMVKNKENKEREENGQHLSLRTWCSRWVRKGIRFSKKHDMHRIAISLVINYWFFQRSLF